MKLKQRCFIGYQPRTRETRASNATPPPPPDTGSNAVKPSPELKIILDDARKKTKNILQWDRNGLRMKGEFSS